MGFAEIIGHRRQLETLRVALKKRRLHHAYLFVGPDGVGKRTVAFSLAQAIHCVEIEDDFCGRCAACVRIRKGNHPDVRFIEPLSGKKEISIQQVRELEKELFYRSFSGGGKVAIIDPATLMNGPAQNALLKTLEEPPKESLIVLIAAAAGGLLPTVRSRCLSLSFGPLKRGLIAEYLVSKGKAPEAASDLAALAMGSLGVAITLEEGELLEKRQIWVEMLSSLSAGDYRAAMAAAEAIAGNRDESLKFLEWAGSWYRDLVIYTVTQSPEEIVNLNMIGHIEKQSSEIGLEQLLSSVSQTVEAARQIHRNVNRRMAIEDLLFGPVEGR
ncbi:MAG: DNA polymerase III subunit delta' [Candidatus Binatia bacterium]